MVLVMRRNAQGPLALTFDGGREGGKRPNPILVKSRLGYHFGFARIPAILFKIHVFDPMVENRHGIGQVRKLAAELSNGKIVLPGFGGIGLLGFGHNTGLGAPCQRCLIAPKRAGRSRPSILDDGRRSIVDDGSWLIPRNRHGISIRKRLKASPALPAMPAMRASIARLAGSAVLAVFAVFIFCHLVSPLFVMKSAGDPPAKGRGIHWR